MNPEKWFNIEDICGIYIRRYSKSSNKEIQENLKLVMGMVSLKKKTCSLEPIEKEIFDKF